MITTLLEHLGIQLFVFFMLCAILDESKLTIKDMVILFLISVASIYIPLLTIYIIIANGGHLVI